MRKQIARIVVGKGSAQMGVTPDGRLGFVSLSAENRIATIGSASRKVTGNVFSGRSDPDVRHNELSITEGISMRTHIRPTNSKTTKNASTSNAKTALVPVPPPAPQPLQVSHAAAMVPSSASAPSFIEQAFRYQIDRWQRSVLSLDMLRERANNMLTHEEAGMPAPLGFEYETIHDARRFESPENYALLRITRCHENSAADCVDDKKAPVIIIDPRAGHDPGIGGFKRDSEVGMALHEGHATYFAFFFPLPCPGQALADVLHALRRLVEEVSRRHNGLAPVLDGNCQAGWAVTRLAGGLTGGSWLAHWLADLGNGRLDGAWLVQGFENLNPANTLWDKNYNVFAHVDTERERFLEFERWWTGYHFLSREEILSIIENLFIGNKLERGTMKICDCFYVDLKRIRNSLVIFASNGDNITPPHQALNSIPTVYPTTPDLKDSGQRIDYLLNTHVGHLGIFVSTTVAKLEHRAILESLDDLDALKPGLYEMKISNPTGDADCRKPQYTVRFEERQVEQIHYPYRGSRLKGCRPCRNGTNCCTRTRSARGLPCSPIRGARKH